MIVQIQSSEKLNGSLYAVLPLPITTGQPVHVHGLFSISPDRARLHQIRDRSTQDQEPAKWNDWLLQGPVPMAWAELLLSLARLYPFHPTFEKWPQSVDSTQDLLCNALDKLLEIITKETLPIWPTDVGYLTATHGLLGTGTESATLRDALREATAPIVYVPQRLQQRAEELFKDRVLCPKTLCQFLKGKSSQITSWSNQTKHKLLEYLLSDSEFIDYGGLALFPFMDGIYRSIGEHAVFVHRDSFENDLFRLEDFHTLDLARLSEATQRILKRGCEFSTIHPAIRYRSAESLREYCINTVFKKMPEHQDMVELDEESAAFVSKVWTWISKRQIDILDKNVSSLWLVPLSNGFHRKVKPRPACSQIYLAPEGEIGELMRKFDANSELKPLPLIDIRAATHFISILMKAPAIMADLSVEDGSSMVVFLRWLHQTCPLIDDVADEVKLLIASLAASRLPQRLTPSDRGVVVEALSHLKIFQKLSWEAAGDKMFAKTFPCPLDLANRL